MWGKVMGMWVMFCFTLTTSIIIVAGFSTHMKTSQRNFSRFGKFQASSLGLLKGSLGNVRTREQEQKQLVPCLKTVNQNKTTQTRWSLFSNCMSNIVFAFTCEVLSSLACSGSQLRGVQRVQDLLCQPPSVQTHTHTTLSKDSLCAVVFSVEILSLFLCGE